jgi:hypothetical protein
MESLQHYPSPQAFIAAAPANDDCARIPVMPLQSGYRRLALRSDRSRRTLAAALLAAAFCVHWFVIRDAAPAELGALRAELQTLGNPAAVDRFDAAVRAEPTASLLRLHWLSHSSSR